MRGLCEDKTRRAKSRAPKRGARRTEEPRSQLRTRIFRNYRRVGLLPTIVLAVSIVTRWLLAQGRPEDLRSAISSQYRDIGWVNVPTWVQWLSEQPPPVFLDARRADEFAVSHLRGASRIDPDHPDLSTLGTSHEQRIVVYFSVGYRSARIARTLAKSGENLS